MLQQNQQVREKTGHFLLLPNKTFLLKLTFLLFLIFIPFQLGKHFWPSSSFVLGLRVDFLSPTLFISDVFIFLFILSSFINNYDRILKKKNYFIFGSFILCFLILNVFVSPNKLEGFYFLLKFLEYNLLIISLINFFKNFSYQRLYFYGLASSLFIESLLAIAQFLKHGSMGGVLYLIGERNFNSSTPGIANASLNGNLILRPYATFPHPNVLAFYLFVGIFFIIYVFKNLKYAEKYLAIFICVLSEIALLLTFSRLGIVLLTIFLILKIISWIKNPIYKIVALALFILIASVIFLKTPLFYRFNSFDEEDITQRIYLLNIAQNMFSKNLFFGIGLGNFLEEIPKYSLEIHQKIILIQPVHNIFALVASEEGILGLIFAVFGSLYLIFKLFLKKYYLLLILFLEILFWGNFDHFFLTLQQGQILLSLTLAFIFFKIDKNGKI